ncbi:MAG: hypothetical protein ACHQUC_06245, partial [Chlamydiales bacterium]
KHSHIVDNIFGLEQHNINHNIKLHIKVDKMRRVKEIFDLLLKYNQYADDLQHGYQASFAELEDLVGDIDYLISDDLSDLLRSKARQDCIKIQGIQKGLFAVWLVAETFRYPPMLFYGLLILHLFDNGYINAKQIKEIHFGFQENSHRKFGNSCKLLKTANQGECVLQGSSTTEKNNENENDFRELQQANFNILKLFHKGLYNRIDSTNPILKIKYASCFLRFYLNYYMKLSGFISSHLQFTELFNTLEKSY